jgi:hypothetical protein
MPVRQTMAELIARLRSLISDEDAEPVFSDDTLQEALDLRRTEHRYAYLNALPTIAHGGVVTYTDHEAGLGNWEANEKLFDYSFQELTVADGGADHITGRWTLTTSQPVVLIKGFSYDLYAAAADVLEKWASRVKLEVDFQINRRQFMDSQQRQALLELAKTYRAQALCGSSDYAPAEWSYGG